MAEDEYVPTAVRRVKEGSVSSVVPAFDKRWPDLEQLKWHAAVTELDAGLPPGTIQVSEAEYRIAGVRQRGYFNLQVPGVTAGPVGFNHAWSEVNGIGLGAQIPRPQHDAEVARAAKAEALRDASRFIRDEQSKALREYERDPEKSEGSNDYWQGTSDAVANLSIRMEARADRIEAGEGA